MKLETRVPSFWAQKARTHDSEGHNAHDKHRGPAPLGVPFDFTQKGLPPLPAAKKNEKS